MNRQDGTRLTDYREEPTMQAAKQEALNTINQLPENTDMDEIMYRLYMLDKISDNLSIAQVRFHYE